MIYTGNSPKNESLDYGVRYQVFQGKNGKIVIKERFFKDQKSLDNFIDKESEKDNFYRVLSTTTPQNESVDPFKGLKRAKDDADMKSGKYVTDGRGSVYEIPTSGKSQVVKIDGYDFRYNYSTKEIEMYKGSNKITSMGLSAGNWFDGPEYWCKKMIEELDESTTPTKTKKKAIYSFGRGEGSPVYDTLVQKDGESDREFSRRADKKYYDDMHKKESPGDSRNAYMKIVEESLEDKEINEGIRFSDSKIQKKIYDEYKKHSKVPPKYPYKAYTAETFKNWYEYMISQKFIKDDFLNESTLNEASNPKADLKSKINQLAVSLNKNGKDGPSRYNQHNLRELALAIIHYRNNYDSKAFQMYIDMINRKAESWSTPTYDEYRTQYANKLVKSTGMNESVYDGDTANWNKISTGDVVRWTTKGMGRLPKVGDSFRVGPFIGKCIKISGSKVYMKVESNARESDVNESSGHPKLGKKVKQLKGWKIYQGTDQFGETVFRCFTPDDDYPAVGYEDWETDTLDAAISWIKNY